MSSISVTCPQTIRADNHHLKVSQWWKDPVYRALSEQFLKDNPVCEYCGGQSCVVHHDNADSYKSRDEYFKTENFTPACFRCHHMYRGGRKICPSCKEHYILKDGPHDRCRWCRGMKYPDHAHKYKYRPKHPCGNRVGQQRCQRDGRVFVCARSSKDAPGCDYFCKREATTS